MRRVPVFLVDIDGTIADSTHRLHLIANHPKKWDEFFEACDQDPVVRQVLEVVIGLYVEYEVLFITGRPEKIRAKTEKWLREVWFAEPKVLMRPEGDHRDDTVVKLELWQKFKAEHPDWEVEGVFEDRPRVCRMWREQGFTVYQLSDKEF